MIPPDSSSFMILASSTDGLDYIGTAGDKVRACGACMLYSIDETFIVHSIYMYITYNDKLLLKVVSDAALIIIQTEGSSFIITQITESDLEYPFANGRLCPQCDGRALTKFTSGKPVTQIRSTEAVFEGIT